MPIGVPLSIVAHGEGTSTLKTHLQKRNLKWNIMVNMKFDSG